MTGRGSESIISDDDRLAIVSGIIGTIAHDFNNLLTPFLAYPQLIRSDLPENASSHALLEVMEKTAKDMVHINQQLLDLSSRKEMELYPVDINEIVSNVISQLHAGGLITPEMSVHIVLPPGLGRVMGNIDCLVRALYNVCLNAVEAIAADGKLDVRAEAVHVEEGCSASGMLRRKGEYVRIVVADNGYGISEDVRGQIFNPFFTTKKGGSRRGAGLGLSVAFRIIKNHNGFIDFESQPGQGASFSLYLPAETAVELPKPDSVKDSGHGTTAKSLVGCDKNRILIVDDEKTILKLFQMILSTGMPGYTIDMASNGQEAVDAFSGGHHAVLIMDLHMPVMDGQAAFFKIDHLCKEHQWEMPSVVFCTGFAPPDSIRGVIGDDSRHCLLAKPVSGETIIEAVKSRLMK